MLWTYPPDMLIQIDFHFTGYRRLSTGDYRALQRVQPGYLAYLEEATR